MKRSELVHAIRVAAEIAGQDAVIVLGSQSILASFDESELPRIATRSVEVDIAPEHDDDNEMIATNIDVFLGEDSDFQEANGFYIQGAGKRTAVLPDGWRGRLIPVRPARSTVTGWCLDPVDLCVSKLVAMRPKDGDFVDALIEADLIRPTDIRERIGLIADGQHQEDGPVIGEAFRDRLRSWVDGAERRHPRQD